MAVPSTECPQPVGPTQLTAPEYGLLLDKGHSELVMAALTELLARGTVRVTQAGVRSGLRTRRTTLVVIQPTDDSPTAELGPVLAPVLQSLRWARRTVAKDGTSGVTMKHWYESFKKSPGPISYRSRVVEAELLRKGLLEKSKSWYRLTVTRRSSAGEAVHADATRRVAEAKALLAPDTRDSWSREAGTAAAVLAGLGAMGPLLLADPALLKALLEWRAQQPALAVLFPTALDALFSGLDGQNIDFSGLDVLNIDTFSLMQSAFAGGDGNGGSGDGDGGGFGGGGDGGGGGGGD